MRKRLQLMVGSEDDIDLQGRILNSVMALGVIFGAVLTVSNIMMKLPLITTLVTGGVVIVFGYLYLLSRVQRRYQPVSIITTLILVGLVPVIWIINNGSRGGGHYFFIFFAMIIVVINRGKLRLIALVIQLMLIAFMMIFEYHYPEHITGYRDQFTRMIDVSISFFFAAITTWWIFLMIVRNYHREHEKISRCAQKMGELAIRDELTGLYNHRYLMERLREEILRVKRYRRPLSLLMIDIDHFKRVNDQYGHPAGDKVLQKVASGIDGLFSGRGLTGRYGGEEFMVILSGISGDEALELAEQLRGEIARTVFDHNLSITISIGVARRDQHDAASLIDLADQALYRAKEAGRNCVVSEFISTV